MGEGLEGVIAFLGQFVLAGLALVRSPREGHLKEVPPLAERTGADAVPIVVVIDFLIGFVMPYQASSRASGALAVFGPSLYIANLVGLDRESKGIIAIGAPHELAASDDPRVSKFFHRRPRRRSGG